jgi:hypothetical protein
MGSSVIVGVGSSVIVEVGWALAVVGEGSRVATGVTPAVGRGEHERRVVMTRIASRVLAVAFTRSTSPGKMRRLYLLYKHLELLR